MDSEDWLRTRIGLDALTDSCLARVLGTGQLLLGTVLFTLLVFLFPTVFVYYLLLAVARASIAALRLTLALAVVSLNRLPVLAALLLLLDPDAFPAGRIAIVYSSLLKAQTPSPPRAFPAGPTRTAPRPA